MHDVVAHGMSVVAVQAAAGREIVHVDPDRAAEVFATIEAVSRESLAELRRMLGVLRDTGDQDASLSPQPGIADIAGGGRAVVGRGVPTDAAGRGRRAARRAGDRARRLPDRPGGADQRAQARRHVGGGHRAARLRARPAGGRGVPTTGGARRPRCPRPGAGHGLIGMRERVEIYGGELTSGPRPGGGFTVQAVAADRRAPTPARPAGDGERDVSGAAMTIRVAVVDDQALMRDGFTMILDAQTDIDVVGDAENGRLGRGAVPAHPPRRRPDGHPDAGARRHRGDPV